MLLIDGGLVLAKSPSQRNISQRTNIGISAAALVTGLVKWVLLIPGLMGFKGLIKI